MCQELEQLKADNCVEELHIVQWFQPGNNQGWDMYRRLDTYLESSLLQGGAGPLGVVQVLGWEVFMLKGCTDSCNTDIVTAC